MNRAMIPIAMIAVGSGLGLLIGMPRASGPAAPSTASGTPAIASATVPPGWGGMSGEPCPGPTCPIASMPAYQPSRATSSPTAALPMQSPPTLAPTAPSRPAPTSAPTAVPAAPLSVNGGHYTTLSCHANGGYMEIDGSVAWSTHGGPGAVSVYTQWGANFPTYTTWSPQNLNGVFSGAAAQVRVLTNYPVYSAYQPGVILAKSLTLRVILAAPSGPNDVMLQVACSV